MSASELLIPAIAARLQEAARALAARDSDHASEHNGVGFNGTDTWFGHGLAQLPVEAWTPDVVLHAFRVLRKYRVQLQAYGIEFDSIPTPPGEWDERAKNAARDLIWKKASRARTKAWLRADDDGSFTTAFPYDPDLLADLKRCPGRKSWDGAAKQWRIEGDALTVAALVAWADRHEIEILGEIEVDEDAVREAREKAEAEAARPKCRIGLDDLKPGRVTIWFPRDDRVKDALRAAVASARWDGERVCWTASVDDAERIAKFAKDYGFTASIEAHQALGTAAEHRQRMRDASAALDADLDLDGFGVEPHPFQRAGIAYALHAKRTFIADEMGLGKTIQALGTLHAIGDDAFPALVVCPSNVTKKWARETLRALPGRRVSFLDSKAGRGVPVRLYGGGYELVPVNDYRADVFVVNYDKLPRWVEQKKNERGEVVRIGASVQYLPVLGKPIAELLARGLRSLVLDESHYVKNHRAQRTAAIKHLAKGCAVRLALSGTPVLNRPDELIAQLQILDRLESLGGFKEFRRRFVFGGEHALLHERLREVCYVRRLKADVMPELPAKQRDSIELPVSNREEYDRADREFIAWLREQKLTRDDLRRMKDVDVEGLDDDEVEQLGAEIQAAKAERASAAEVLVRMNYLRRLASDGILDAAVEWCEDFLDTTGEKLVVWAFHRRIQEQLAERLAKYGPTVIAATGDKDAAARRFQTDADCRVAVCSITAAREGIELTAASNAAFVELEWRPGVHDQAEDRCYGRMDDPHGMNVYYLLAERTVYADMAAIIDEKRQVIDTIQDGKEGATGGSILDAVVQRILDREGSDR